MLLIERKNNLGTIKARLTVKDGTLTAVEPIQSQGICLPMIRLGKLDDYEGYESPYYGGTLEISYIKTTRCICGHEVEEHQEYCISKDCPCEQLILSQRS